MAKLQTVINDFDAIIEQAVIDTKAEVITLNQTQLLHGFGSDDKRLGTYRNPEYKKQKMTMNPLASGFPTSRPRAGLSPRTLSFPSVIVS